MYYRKILMFFTLYHFINFLLFQGLDYILVGKTGLESLEGEMTNGHVSTGETTEEESSDEEETESENSDNLEGENDLNEVCGEYNGTNGEQSQAVT